MTHDRAIEWLRRLRDNLPSMKRQDGEPIRMGDCQALDYAIAVLGRQERIKTRLAQIASGDYKACGHTAEEVAKTALVELCGERDAEDGKAIDSAAPNTRSITLGELSDKVAELALEKISSKRTANHSEQALDMVTQFDDEIKKNLEGCESQWTIVDVNLLKDMQAHIRKLQEEKRSNDEQWRLQLASLRTESGTAISTAADYLEDIDRKNAMLLEAADDLEGWIDAAHPFRKDYKDNMLKFERDMEIVNRIRKEAEK